MEGEPRSLFTFLRNSPAGRLRERSNIYVCLEEAHAFYWSVSLTDPYGQRTHGIAQTPPSHAQWNSKGQVLTHTRRFTHNIFNLQKYLVQQRDVSRTKVRIPKQLFLSTTAVHLRVTRADETLVISYTTFIL